jgi:LacI family transcriptional regulator
MIRDNGATRVTLRDIAREAGVSVTTVSHALNDTRSVSPQARERVAAVARRLNYRPNSIARSLRSGTTRAIGLMIPDSSNPFFAEIARAIEDIGFETGRSVILCNTDGNIKKEQAYVDVLIGIKVDGVIYIASGGNEKEPLDELINAGVPLVVADRELTGPAVDIIMVDNERGAYAATDYLGNLGHRRIACIAGPGTIAPSQARVRGYQQALAHHHLKYRKELVEEADFRFTGGEAAMERLMRVQPRPTAVFACNDMMAIGALRAIRRAGLKVPSDLSVVGFDGIPLAATVDPPLTTITQPTAELARVAMKCLVGRIERQSESRTAPAARHILTGQLTVRESARAPTVTTIRGS